MAQKYRVIYADPPWKFKTHSHKGLGRSAEAWYDCLSLDEICQMPVEELAAKDCVLLMWTTDPFLEQAFRVIKAWGFTYKTVGFYWMKRHWDWSVSNFGTLDTSNIDKAEKLPIGTGYWTRANPEQCLLATRGAPKRVNADVPKLVVAPRREHSRKPDEVRTRIERLCQGPYIELFARKRVEGWDALGDEVDAGLPAMRRWRANSHPAAPERALRTC